MLIVDVLPQVEVTMLKLVEMQSNPGISITSLTKGKVYNGVDLSGEVAPELCKLHIDLATAAVNFIDARFKPQQTFRIQTSKFLTLCNGHMIRLIYVHME